LLSAFPFMSRPEFDQAACDQLAQCVREIETRTDAELVIVVRARSGSYRHADYLCGAILAYAGLLFLLFSPWTFTHYWAAIDVALLFALGAFVCSRSDPLRRLLTTKKECADKVRVGAAAMFYEAGIANTMNEMGVLVYLSLLERRLELFADRGVLTAAPPLEWNECVFDLHKAGRRPQLQTMLQALRSLGTLLAKCLPPTGENPNELSDMPRFDLR
jgi:putative membrane protein